jgi:hypothetical protein
MRYRRYFPQANKDGSYTVVSAGPLASIWLGLVKFGLWVLAFFWPAAVAISYLRGVPEWLVGIGGELVWLVILSVIYTEVTKRRDSPTASAASPHPSP